VTAFVIDVNVPIVANGHATHADSKCREACIAVLEKIYAKGTILLDDGMYILDEYMQNLSMAGQPGIGDAFMKWVWENQAVTERCERIALTSRGSDPDDFEEFPNDVDLRFFDRSDRKYVAVALASTKNPEVLNAVDRDWWDHREALERNGLRLHFLCPQHMRT